MSWQLLLSTTAAVAGAGGGGTPVVTYDALFANMQGVYSLKKRVSAYSGPAVRIYDSVTTAEQDVGFDSNGRLDSFTVTGEALVKTWYDQKSNNDLTQSSVAQMPRLHPNGSPSFQPAIEFRMGTDEWLETTGWTGYTNALAITRPVVLLASAYETDALFQSLAMVSNNTTHTTPYGRWLIGRNGARKIDFRWDGGVVATSSGPDTYGQWQPLILDGATSGTNIRLYYGEEATYNDYANSINVTYPNTSRLIIGANASGGEGASMMACEMVIASSAPTGSYTDIFTEVETWNDFTDSGFDLTNTSFDDIPYLTPVMGGGMVKRNPSYVGPAIRVYNASTFAETDVNFDGNGFVTGTRPYGTDTRLHTIYDQWGSEDLVVVGTPDATLIEEDGTYKCWRIQWNGGSYLATANTTTTPGAWVIDQCAWAIGLIRTASRAALYNVWGVESTSNFMDVGLWIDTTDAHARLDGGSALDIRGTHYTTNAARVAGVLAPVTGVLGGQNNGIIRCNGEDTATTTAFGYTPPINWDAGKPLCLGGWTGLGSHCLEQTTEFHYFSRANLSSCAILHDGFHQVMNERMKQVLV